MTTSGTLAVAVVGRGFPAAVHRAAWSAAEAWTGVAARVVLETPCWQEAVSHPGVDAVDLVGCAVDDLLPVVLAASSAGRHVVVSEAVVGDVVIGDVAHLGGLPSGRPAPARTPPDWAVRRGGWTVVDLPYRCVPAVALARALVAAGDIGSPRHVRVRGAVSVAVVDLVRTVVGREVVAAHVAAHVAGPTTDRGRLDGILDGGCTVAVRTEEPCPGAADVQVEVCGSEGTVRVDLRRPLTVELAAGDRTPHRLRAPVARHPYPAVMGPAHHPCRARRAAEHLVVDAVEAIAGGREDVPCLGDVLAVAGLSAQRFEAGGEVTQGSRLLDDAVPVQLARA